MLNYQRVILALGIIRVQRLEILSVWPHHRHHHSHRHHHQQQQHHHHITPLLIFCYIYTYIYI